MKIEEILSVRNNIKLMKISDNLQTNLCKISQHSSALLSFCKTDLQTVLKMTILNTNIESIWNSYYQHSRVSASLARREVSCAPLVYCIRSVQWCPYRLEPCRGRRLKLLENVPNVRHFVVKLYSQYQACIKSVRIKITNS